MANPISNIPAAGIPPITEPLVTQGGTVTPSYYRFFTGLQLRTGGNSGLSSGDAANIAQSALTQSTIAKQEAEHATQTANAASATATALSSQVTAATTIANQAAQNAANVQPACLQKFANLGDLTDPVSARKNIGLAILPVTYSFDSLPSGLRRGVALVYAGRVEANFAGLQLWADVMPTANAVFVVSFVRAGLDTRIGSVTLLPAGTVQLSVQSAVNLQVGDALVVQCPSPADSTLARVAITVPMTL